MRRFGSCCWVGCHRRLAADTTVGPAVGDDCNDAIRLALGGHRGTASEFAGGRSTDHGRDTGPLTDEMPDPPADVMTAGADGCLLSFSGGQPFGRGIRTDGAGKSAGLRRKWWLLHGAEGTDGAGETVFNGSVSFDRREHDRSMSGERWHGRRGRRRIFMGTMSPA